MDFIVEVVDGICYCKIPYGEWESMFYEDKWDNVVDAIDAEIVKDPTLTFDDFFTVREVMGNYIVGHN